MNILPKKRWHVRTKENIARVRKDEAEAAEKERQEKLRIDTADREARLNVLKNKSKQKLHELGVVETAEVKTSPAQHINFFENFENAIKTTNKDHDKEIKDKKEEYEKKIGYLTYLGQDTNEALGKKNWYEVAPGSSRFARSNEIKETYEKLVLRDEDGKPRLTEPDVKDNEICWKAKKNLDPINAFKKYCHKPIVQNQKSDVNKNNDSDISSLRIKHKSKRDKSKDKEEKLRKLREARLKREEQEKYRTKLLLTGLSGSPPVEEDKSESRVKAKYNSQFNPELARQNYR